MFSSLLIFKIANSVVENKERGNDNDNDDSNDDGLDMTLGDEEKGPIMMDNSSQL